MTESSNNSVDGLRVGIVGGSIAGCTMAIELSRIGCDVTLFERSGEELKDRGAGIGVPPSVLSTFIDRDLVDADIPFFAARTFSRIWRTDAQPRYGYLAWDQPAQVQALNWGGLYRNLRARVADSSYRTGAAVVALTQPDDGHAMLQFADGTAAEFDLVVCADGYNSLGRRTLFPRTEIAYPGYVLWRGFIPESEIAESAPMDDGIRCLGYHGGHGIFYFVPGANGSVERGQRLVNWGVYVPVPTAELAGFMTDRAGRQREGSLAPGTMPLATEEHLKAHADKVLPSYYADIVRQCTDTFAYAIYDCEVPAYRVGRICLAGDAGAFARPHSAAGTLKGINDAVALSTALGGPGTLEEALTRWNSERTQSNNELVRLGNQLGLALVKNIPDWSTMEAHSMATWFTSVVTMRPEFLSAKQ